MDVLTSEHNLTVARTGMYFCSRELRSVKKALKVAGEMSPL